jgi:hypothetical protein
MNMAAHQPDQAGQLSQKVARFMRAIAAAPAGSIAITDGGNMQPCRWEIAQPTGEGDNEVAILSWASGVEGVSAQCTVMLTEEGIDAGRWSRNGFACVDSEGEPVRLSLPAPQFLVLQEGGSTGELYPHIFDSPEDAQAYRQDCTVNGAYRTSPVVEVPAALAANEGLIGVLEDALRASTDLDYVDVDVDVDVDEDAVPDDEHAQPATSRPAPG